MSPSQRRPQRPVSHPVHRLIDISPDLAVLPCLVAAVKRLDDETCAVFVLGQSATDGGFRVERDWSELVGELNDELERAAEEAGGGGDGEYDEDGEDDDDDSAAPEER